MAYADIFPPDKRSDIMARVKSKDTGPELKLRSALHGLGYRFGLHGKRLPGKPDIVLRRYRTAVFVHGCFWHQHVKCRKSVRPKTNVEFWNTKLDKNIERDSLNVKHLMDSNWTVFIAWECQISNGLESVIEKLMGIIHKCN